MWFKMPTGVGSISVERQEFAPTLFDENGRGMFCAPAHFASKIFLFSGFEVIQTPEGQEDSPVFTTEQHSDTVDQLTERCARMGEEIDRLRAQLAIVTTERDGLIRQSVQSPARGRSKAASPAEELVESLSTMTFGKD